MNRGTSVLVLIPSLFAVVSACSSSDSGAAVGATTPAPTPAPVDLGPPEPRVVKAEAEYLVKCASLPAVSAQKRAQLLLPNLRLQGRTPAQIAALAVCKEARVASCSDRPKECVAVDALMGTLKVGASCLTGASCETGACDGGAGDFGLLDSRFGCGKCVAPAGVGATCDNDVKTPVMPCSFANRCVDGKCVPPEVTDLLRAKVGEVCGLIGATSNTERTCEAGGLCDFDSDGTSEKPTCKQIPKVGESCDGIYLCVGGARCDAATKMCVDGSTALALGDACNGNDYCKGLQARCRGAVCKTVSREKDGEGACLTSDECGVGFYCLGASSTSYGVCTDAAEGLTCEQ